jgi:iron complex outermembrane receptor protein
MSTPLFCRCHWLVGFLTLTTFLLPRAAGAQTSAPGQDLRSLSLEELMGVPVTVTNRVPKSRLTTPASVFVMTSDDIRQSGATTLPEALRMVPGMHVAQIDGNKWAIGIRGFTDRLARAMLVLIDGRPVYSPLFAGTYWEVQDLPLSDIERIEVVRGPGGSLWGANAVTGVVNIVRKTAAASAGTTVIARAGTEDPFTLAASHGGGRTLQYRVSGKIATRSPQSNPLGLEYDDARLFQMGARAEWQNAAGAFMVQGDAYRAVIGQRDSLVTFVPPSRRNEITDDTLTGANLMARWTRRPSDPRSLQVQIFYDRTTREELVFSEQQNVFDIDLQHGLLRGRHSLLWGAGFRQIDGNTQTRGTLSFTTPDRTDQLYTAFVQDDVALVRDRLSVTVGTKVEHNAYSGVEWQPSGRLAWTVSPSTAVSLSLARAVRTPSRVEHDFSTGNLVSPVPVFVRLTPNPRFRSEELTALEGSVVTMPLSNLLTTVAVFRNRHDHVLSGELFPAVVETGAFGARVVLPILFGNGLHGHSYGVEITNDVRPTSWWRTTLNYSWLRVHLQKKPGSVDASQEIRGEGGSPRHQLQLATTWHLPRRVTVDWFLRGLSGLPALRLPGYVTSNLRVDWAFSHEAGLFVQGRNLHHDGHPEFNDGSNGVFDIQRAFVVGLRWNR